MKRLNITIAAVFGICSLAFAQNIDQTVQVSNDYLTVPVTAVKNGVTMVVPDTATRFKLDFDYDVFDNPYKGAYEFVPYTVRFTPDPTKYDGRKFYLKAGAGYALHPVLDAYFIPVNDSLVQLCISQNLSGYAGMYLEGFRGMHFTENLGLSGHYQFKKATMVFGCGYNGYFLKGSEAFSPMHSLYANLGVKSRAFKGNYFKYDLDLSYGFGSDFLFQGFPTLNAHIFKLNGTLGPVFNGKYGILVDLDLNIQKYTGVPELENSVWKSTLVTANNVKPHFYMVTGPFSLKAGAALSFAKDGKTSFTVYPDVKVEARIANALKLYASLTGGSCAKDYLQVKAEDPWYFEFKSGVQWIQNTINDFDAKAGLSGRIGKCVSFDINAVRTKFINGRLPDASSFYSFLDYTMLGANFALNVNTKRVDADINLHYRKTDIMAEMPVFDLPRLYGSASLTYNYANRLYVGASVKASAGRYAYVNPGSVTSEFNIPQYVNLGINARFYFTKKLAVWLDASNLLGHTMVYHYGVSEKGRAFTGGIILEM